MSKIALAIAIVTLAAAPFATGHAQAPPQARFVPPPGAAPPWGDTTTKTTTTTTTETPQTPAPTAAATPASTVPPPTDASGTTTPGPVAATPMQGTTTPIRVVSLRAGPNSSAPVIGTLHPGDQLQILATANYGWTQVQSPAGTGWAYGSYLARGGSSATGQPPATPLEEVIRGN
jgi:hypothetical protein